MKRLLTTLAVVIGATAIPTSDAVADPIYELKIRFEQQIADLHATYRIQKEECDQQRRHQLDELRIQRRQALQLCEPERGITLRNIDAQREVILIKARNQHAALRGEFELTKRQLRHTYESQRAALLAAAAPVAPVTVETYRPVLPAPASNCRLRSTSWRVPGPTFQIQWQSNGQHPGFRNAGWRIPLSELLQQIDL